MTILQVEKIAAGKYAFTPATEDATVTYVATGKGGRWTVDRLDSVTGSVTKEWAKTRTLWQAEARINEDVAATAEQVPAHAVDLNVTAPAEPVDEAAELAAAAHEPTGDDVDEALAAHEAGECDECGEQHAADVDCRTPEAILADAAPPAGYTEAFRAERAASIARADGIDTQAPTAEPAGFTVDATAFGDQLAAPWFAPQPQPVQLGLF